MVRMVRSRRDLAGTRGWSQTAGRWLFACASFAVAPAVLLPAPAAAQQQLSPDDQAAQLLNAANRAFNDGKLDQSTAQFREFLTKYAAHKDAASASFGLGLSLIEGPQKDYPAAIDALNRVVAANTSDKPLALYYIGAAHRHLGHRSLAEAAAKPAEAAQHKAAATAKFDEAAKQFLLAVAAIAESKMAGEYRTEWASRCRCDAAEMFNRIGKHKEALEAVMIMIPGKVEGPLTPYRALATYQAGYARFALKEHTGAGRLLSRLAPFDQEFGVHARYLLGRVHHIADERPEASAQYKAVVTGFEAQKKAAQASLQSPAGIPADRKSFLESIANGPVPQYVVRAGFYSACLLEEDAKFTEAADQFTKLATHLQQTAATSPMLPEANLHLGFCRMQLKSYADAAKTLDPLKDHPQFGDRALWWLARCQIQGANPSDAAAYEAAVKAGIERLRVAADRANQRAAQNDAEAKVRRGDILMELADSQQLIKLYADAANTYQAVITEKSSPDRVEEATHRRVTALHLAGQSKPSDDLAALFEKTYPKSTLLPDVLFRRAENAYLDANAAANDPARRNNREELAKLFSVAIERYQKLIDAYPEFEYGHLARHAMASAYHRTGRYKEAIDTLVTIPEPDRSGPLATVNYLLADCHIRSFPPETDDALQAAELIHNAEHAAKLLESFVGGLPKESPQLGDAYLKLGYCHLRIGQLLAEKAERTKTLAKSRETFEKAAQAQPNGPSTPSIVFERARCIALQGDPGGASNELRRFQNDPLKATPNAPLALLRLSSLLRSQNQAAQAVDAIARCRNEHEAACTADPQRKDWVPMLRYEHGLALKEAKKLPEARAIFEALAKDYPDRAEGINALWRLAQCRRDEAAEPLAKAMRDAGQPGARPEDVEKAYAAADAQLASIREAVAALTPHALHAAQHRPGSEGHLQILYELAWCNRVLGEAEAERKRRSMQAEQLQKARARITKELPAGATIPTLIAPYVDPSEVPVPPAELQARDHYKTLIAARGDAPLAAQARFELAEMLARRGENEPALALLAEALVNNAPVELADRIKVRAAACQLARGDAKAAAAQVQAVMNTPASPVANEARYLAGEAAIQQEQWQQAAELLAPFRDQEPLRNLPDISDRAMLRLSFAYFNLKQHEPSRQAAELMIQRYGGSMWVADAWSQMGQSLQAMNRLDEAVNAYNEVVKRTAAEIAASAQLQVGAIRLEQKRAEEALRALLSAAYTYDYPEITANAWYEAGRAQLELKKQDEARASWQRVTKDHAATKWAALAQQRLGELK